MRIRPDEIRIVLALSLALWCVHVWAEAGRDGRPQLRFRRDGTFTLVQLADLHYGSPEFRDRRTTQVQRAVLGAEGALDLALFSGDQVTGFMEQLEGRQGGSTSWYERQLRRALAPVWEAGLPYAVTLGNHDAEGDLSRAEIAALDGRLSNRSLTQLGPPHLAGSTNYWLDILEPEGEGVAARIWMLDSGDRGCDGAAAGWGCVGSDTLAWVAATAASLPPVPTQLAVIHIPLRQFMEAWAAAPTNGSKAEPTGCPAADNGAFLVLKAAGVQAIYSGHDHNNDFLGELQGVRLAYGRKTGVGNYGPPAGWAHGARMVRLRLNQSAALSETWIRNARGEREEQQVSPPHQKKRIAEAQCAAPSNLLP